MNHTFFYSAEVHHPEYSRHLQLDGLVEIGLSSENFKGISEGLSALRELLLAQGEKSLNKDRQEAGLPTLDPKDLSLVMINFGKVTL